MRERSPPPPPLCRPYPLPGATVRIGKEGAQAPTGPFYSAVSGTAGLSTLVPSTIFAGRFGRVRGGHYCGACRDISLGNICRILGLRSALERDEARELIAKERYAAAQRKASPFHAAAWTEGCPEGTPGCRTRSSLGYLEKPSSGIELEMPSMQRAGDKRVSAAEAMQQVPHLF